MQKNNIAPVDTTNHTQKKQSPVFKNSHFKNQPEPTTEIKPGIYFEKFQSSIMDQQKEYPLPVAIISIFQNSEALPLLTLKSFSLWQGKQKSKKTTALAIAVAAFINGNQNTQETQFIGLVKGTVLFFDNEQGESYAARTMKLILKLCDVNSSPKLIYCDLREFSPNERIKIIEAGIESTPDVRFVVIDGLVDLLTDFMDAGEGHITTSNLLKLCSAYNIHIAGVLHQNKNDKNARAHIGTISSQKCEVEIATEEDPDDRSQSHVVCVNSRGLPFEKFAIRWDKGCLPCINQEWNSVKDKDAQANKKFELAKEIVEAVFKPLSVFSHAGAIQNIMITTLKSKSTAKRYLDDLQLWGLIDKGTDGNYRKNNGLGSKVHAGSNEGS